MTKLSIGRYNARRPREYLSPTEMDCVLQAAREGRHGVRDYAMGLVMLQHGLRVSELCGLTMGDLRLDDPAGARLVVRRLKGSINSEQFLSADTLRAVRRWRTIRDKLPGTDRVFVTAKGDALKRSALTYLVKKWGERAFIAFPIHPHMFRHTCGYAMVNAPGLHLDTRTIQGYLGHRDIRHTIRYTELSAEKFRAVKDVWGG